MQYFFFFIQNFNENSFVEGLICDLFAGNACVSVLLFENLC
jgi:hypothetical protein